MLIPLALRDCKISSCWCFSATAPKETLIYGLGGMIAPFIGIKIIDMIVGLLFLDLNITKITIEKYLDKKHNDKHI